MVSILRRLVALRTCDMLAADAANGLRDFPDRLFKPLRQMQHLPSAVIEDGSQLSPKRAVFILPKIDRREHHSAHERAASKSISGRMRPGIVRQSVESNRELACPYSAQHLHAHQALRKEDRMTAIHGNRVERLQPRQWISFSAKRMRTPCPCRRPRRRIPRRAAHSASPGADVQA